MTQEMKDAYNMLERLEQHRDYIGELVEDLPLYDMRVSIRVDGKPQILRFSSADAFAQWLADGWVK